MIQDIQVRIGRVTAGPGEFAISIVAKPDGRGFISLYACNSHDDDPEESVLGMFDLDSWNKLRRLIRETDAAIQQMSFKKQLIELTIDH